MPKKPESRKPIVFSALQPSSDCCLYLFFDEAGNFDVSPRGSVYFILCCVLTKRPFTCADSLISLRRDYFEDGLDIEYFHATNDHKRIRAKVFSTINDHRDDLQVYYAVANKEEFLDDGLKSGSLYCELFESLFCLIAENVDLSKASQILAVTDLLPIEVRSRQYMSRLKEALKSRSFGPYRISHRRSMSDKNLQIADYCCWAFQRKIEHGDASYLDNLELSQSYLLIHRAQCRDDKTRTALEGRSSRPSRLSLERKSAT